MSPLNARPVLRGSVRGWMRALCIVFAIMAALAFFWPASFSTVAYNLAISGLLPLKIWGLVWSTGSLLAGYAWRTESVRATRIVLLLHTFTNVVFGLSILWFTATGAINASLGALQWVLLGYVSVGMLLKPLTTIRSKTGGDGSWVKQSSQL